METGEGNDEEEEKGQDQFCSILSSRYPQFHSCRRVVAVYFLSA